MNESSFFEENNQTIFCGFGMLLQNPGNISATELRIMAKRVRSVWFQWGDAAAHSTRQCMILRIGMFSGRFISCFGYIHWPACSSDLRYLDFFLWRSLNFELYAAPYKCTQKQIIRITQAIVNRQHWRALVQPSLPWKNNNCYIFWVCVCSVSYPACKASALYYIVIYVVSGCTTFFHIIS